MTDYITKLLDGQAVQWRTLGEVAEIKRGKTLAKADKGLGTYPMVLYGELYTTYGQYIQDICSRTSSDRAMLAPIAQKGDILLPISSTTKEAQIGKASVLSTDYPVYVGSDAAILRIKEQSLLPEFLMYLMNSLGFEKAKMDCVTGTTIMHLSPKKLMQIRIPIPPLRVQRRIVEILDTFSALTAELEAELEGRRKQYAYYREQLLSFNNVNPKGGGGIINVKYLPLGEVGNVRMCKRILKEQTQESGEVPFYKIGTFGKEPNAYISRKLFEEYKSKYSYPKMGDILISASGTIGKTVIFDGQDAYFQDSNIVWIEHDESQVLNKYLYYCYQEIKWDIAEGGTIQRLYNDGLKKATIPVPPLEEQRRIVDILDRFSTLCESLTEGLPREIELRRKQYEYYREKLLTFPQS